MNIYEVIIFVRSGLGQCLGVLLFKPPGANQQLVSRIFFMFFFLGGGDGLFFKKGQHIKKLYFFSPFLYIWKHNSVDIFFLKSDHKRSIERERQCMLSFTPLLPTKYFRYVSSFQMKLNVSPTLSLFCLPFVDLI